MKNIIEILCLVQIFLLLRVLSKQSVSGEPWRAIEPELKQLTDFNDGNVMGFHNSSGIVAHSRKRRYVVFPEGSTFTVAFCTSVKALTGSDSIFTEGVNWALSYDLPNETIHELNKRPYPLRRQKRDLYQRFEKLIQSAGFDGRQCILRAICETSQILPPRRGVLEEIIRLIFTYPLENEKVEKLNTGNHREYAEAHQCGISNQNCVDIYSCPISIMELALNFGEKQPALGLPPPIPIHDT